MYGTDIGVDRYWHSKWHRYECGTVCGTGTYKCSTVLLSVNSTSIGVVQVLVEQMAQVWVWAPQSS